MDKLSTKQGMDMYRIHLDRAMDMIIDEKTRLLVWDMLNAAEFATRLEINGFCDSFQARRKFLMDCKFTDLLSKEPYLIGATPEFKDEQEELEWWS